MAGLAVVTPSYAPDLELCKDLNTSVLRHTPDSTLHYIITPRRDQVLFSVLRGPRTRLLSVEELLPTYVVGVPRANFWLNLRRPFPPVRGWVMQQLIKLQATAQIEADVLLLADSDVLFVRPVAAETFQSDGRMRFYRKEAEVDQHLPRHLIWHDVARALLGVPQAGPPLPDYISPFNAWDRRTVLSLLDRIQYITGRAWLDAVASQLHFSEFILYGVFVDDVLGEQANVTRADSMLCHSYWGHTPLSLDAAEQFVHALPAEDVTVMISAKSGTPLGVRRAALSKV